MAETHQHDSLKLMRRLMPLTTAAIIIAALYVAWVFFSRWEENRELERRRSETAAENARKVVETLGGNELKILSLSLDRGLIRRGEKINLCYGVMNAIKVSIEPRPSEETWPSTQRCVTVAPTANTTYTLTAQDSAGRIQTAAVTVHVAK